MRWGIDAARRVLIEARDSRRSLLAGGFFFNTKDERGNMTTTLEESQALGFATVQECDAHAQWIERRRKNAETIYAKVLEAKDVEGLFHAIPWKPWINCNPKDQEQTKLLILHRWIRDRGGIQPNENLSVSVYTHDGNTPLHDNGNPKYCLVTVYNVAHEDA